MSALVDGALDAAVRDVLVRHIDGCDACRGDLGTLASADQVVRHGLDLLLCHAPPRGYFDGLWTRVDARLMALNREEDSMAMSTGSNGRLDNGQGSQDNTGLHDIRNLASKSIERYRQRHSSEHEAVTAALLEATSPAALGQVVLPAPGHKAVTGQVAVAGRSRRGPLIAAVGALAVLGGVVAVVVVTRSRKISDAAQVVSPGPAVAQIAPAPAMPKLAAPVVTRLEGEPTPPPSATPPAAPPVATPIAEASAPVKKGPAPEDEKLVKKAEGPQPEMATAPKSAGSPVAQAAVAAAPVPTAAPEKQRPKDDIDDLLNRTVGKPAAEAKSSQAQPQPAAALPEKLSTDDVRAGIARAKARIQACYDKYKVAGTIELKIRIEPNGTVSAADAIDAKFGGTETGFCVEQAVQVVKFQPFSGTPLTLKYKFVLR